MKPLALLALLLPFAAAEAQDAPAAPAVPALEHVLPASAILVAGTPDADSLGKDLRASSTGCWWNDASNAALRSALSGWFASLGAEAEKQVGGNPFDLLGFLHGRVALVALGPGEDDPQEDELPAGLSVGLVADTGADREACEKLLLSIFDHAEALKDSARRTVTVGDTDVLMIEDTHGEARGRIELAFHGETLLLFVEMLPLAHDPVEQVLDALDGGSIAALAAVPRFRDSLGAHAAPMQLWMDLGRMLGWVRTRLEQRPEEDEASEPAELEVLDGDGEELEELEASEEPDSSAEALLWMGRLGLFELQSFSATAGWTAAGSHSEGLLAWPGDGWIPAFLHLLLRPGGEDLLGLVPDTALMAFAGRPDFGGIFDQAVKCMLESGAATAAEVTDALASGHEALGFDVRDDLLDALDGRVAVFTARVPPLERMPFSEGEPENFCLLLGLKDGERITTLVEDVLRQTGLHAARKRAEFQGFEVFSVPLMPGLELHYALRPDLAVLSLSPTMLQDVLRRKAGLELPSVAGNAEFKQRLALLHAPHGLVQYSNTAEYMKQTLRQLSGVFALLQSELDMLGADVPASVRQLGEDLARLPPLDEATVDRCLKGASVGAVGFDERGLVFESAGP